MHTPLRPAVNARLRDFYFNKRIEDGSDVSFLKEMFGE